MSDLFQNLEQKHFIGKFSTRHIPKMMESQMLAGQQLTEKQVKVG